jgi:hypothetical protein
MERKQSNSEEAEPQSCGVMTKYITFNQPESQKKGERGRSENTYRSGKRQKPTDSRL